MFITEADFRQLSAYENLPDDSYVISYHDNTHLPDDEWVPLIELSTKSPASSLTLDTVEKYYIIRSLRPSNDLSQDQERVLVDALSLSIARTGLLSPNLSEEIYRDVLKLSNQDGVILVPDTNAFYNGALHWLFRVLHNSQIWLLPFVVSLIQIQQRDTLLKGLVNKKNKSNCAQALRSRALVNASMGLLERYRNHYQVLELDPSLLRYMPPAGRGTVDPDEGDVLEDRLLIEGVHAIFSATRTRATQRVVTSDVLLARILHTEGIPTLFLAAPLLDDKAVSCIRYNPIARSFYGAPLSSLLWDLTHTFSSIRVAHSVKFSLNFLRTGLGKQQRNGRENDF
jgi:hypothetical protein